MLGTSPGVSLHVSVEGREAVKWTGSWALDVRKDRTVVAHGLVQAHFRVLNLPASTPALSALHPTMAPRTVPGRPTEWRLGAIRPTIVPRTAPGRAAGWRLGAIRPTIVPRTVPGRAAGWRLGAIRPTIVPRTAPGRAAGWRLGAIRSCLCPHRHPAPAVPITNNPTPKEQP